MKKADKLKKQRFEIEMKIIDLESRQSGKGLSKNEEKELQILKNKALELTDRIETIKN
jgi:hypothetical protein